MTLGRTCEKAEKEKVTGWMAGIGPKAHYLDHGVPVCGSPVGLSEFGWDIEEDELATGFPKKRGSDGCYSVMLNPSGDGERRMYEACLRCLRMCRRRGPGLRILTSREQSANSVVQVS